MNEESTSNRPRPIDAPFIESVSDLVLVAGRLRPKTVIIAGGDREEDLRLVESARDHGIVDRCLLVGSEAAIRASAGRIGLPLDDRDIVATVSPEETAARTAERVRMGGIHIVLKGNISTPILNRAMMRIVVRNTISLVSLFDTAPIAGGRPMLLTDAGVTTVCTYGRLVGLIENAVEVARAILGMDRPRVAVLSANEKVIDSLPSTRLGQALTRRDWKDAVVYGPLSLDLAVDPESVGLKGLGGEAAAEVAGRADILVCPGIDSANVLYKMIMESVKYGVGTLASMAVGISVPYSILSRADNVETKLQSLALCSIASERMDLSRPRTGLSRQGGSAGRLFRILAVEHAPASTRVALYENDRCLDRTILPCAPPAKGGERQIDEQDDAERRFHAVKEYLRRHDHRSLDGIVARGGPVEGAEGPRDGVYLVADVRDQIVQVDERWFQAPTPWTADLRLAAALARDSAAPAFCLGAGVGFGLRAAARQMAARSGLQAEEMHCVVARLDPDSTIAAVSGDRVIDSEELPAFAGMPSGLAEASAAEIEKRIDSGDDATLRAVEAVIARIAKCVGAMCAAAGPDAEAIVLMGELCQSSSIVQSLRKRLAHLFPVFVLKDSPVLDELAAGAWRALGGEQEAKRFAQAR